MAQDRMHEVVLEDPSGFTIRVGSWSYYIRHEEGCEGTAYSVDVNLKPKHRGECKRCHKEYPIELEGFIRMLDWGLPYKGINR